MTRLAPVMLMLGIWSSALSAADEPNAYQALAQQDLRLASVGYHLASANAPLCDRTLRNPGWVLHDAFQYSDPRVARAAFALRAPVGLSAVVPGGPADAAGLKAGDGIVAVNGADIGSLQAKPRSTARLEAVAAKLADALSSNAPVTVTAETASGRQIFTLNPPAICASKFWLDTKGSLDAGADGDGVRVTEGLLTFTAQDDAELAAVVAHEMAHNLLGHRQRLSRDRSRKAILATEIEADRLSVWLMANAGYDPVAALRLAERYGRKTGLGIFSDGTHPRWKNRVKSMQAEIELIQKTGKAGGLYAPPLLTR